MFIQDKMDCSKNKDEILNIVTSDNFKKLFLNKDITNVIIWGSLVNDDFTQESDVNIAIISKN